MKSKRIAVLAPMGTLDQQPGVLRAADSFADAGYVVDVFTVRNEYYPRPEFTHRSIHLHLMPLRMNRQREPRTLVTLVFAFWVLLRLRGPYEVIYAAGVRGLFAAYILHLLRGARVVNYQIELYVGGYGRIRFLRLFKFLERRAIRASLFSIEHDETRAQILCQDSGIPRHKIVVVPNAPRGIGEDRRTKFLHMHLGLDPRLRLLVSAGAIEPDVLSLEIVRAVQTLPDAWRCVFHSSVPRTEDDAYIHKLVEADSDGKVSLSLQPVSSTEVDDLVASATIGLALYSSSVRPDLELVGLASGKLCRFLRSGVPVIVSDFPALREFVLSHGVGIAISDVCQIEDAIERIEADYEGYRGRAVECFTRRLSHDVHFRQVLDRIGAS